MRSTNDKNDAESVSFSIQKIIEQEIETIRKLLSFLSFEETLQSKETLETKKGVLRERSELYKKLRSIKKDKDLLFEKFFFDHHENIDLALLNDHLQSIQSELDRKQYRQKKTLKILESPARSPMKRASKNKTTVSTIDSQELS